MYGIVSFGRRALSLWHVLSLHSFILPGRQQCACSTSLISSRIHQVLPIGKSPCLVLHLAIRTSAVHGFSARILFLSSPLSRAFGVLHCADKKESPRRFISRPMRISGSACRSMAVCTGCTKKACRGHMPGKWMSLSVLTRSRARCTSLHYDSAASICDTSAFWGTGFVRDILLRLL